MAIACKKSALVRVGKSSKKPPMKMISCHFGRWKQMRALHFGRCLTLWAVLCVCSVFSSEEDIDFLNAFVNVGDQNGKLHAVYTTQKL